MQELFQETGFLRWRRAFPWLHLLRIPGIAFRTQILFAGFVAVFFHFVCGLVASKFNFQEASVNSIDLFVETDQLSTANNLLSHSRTLFEQAVAPHVVMYELVNQLRSLNFSSLVLTDLLYLLNFLFFGLVICRMACSEFTKGTGLCLERSTFFAVKKLPAVITGILFPFLFILLLFALAWLIIVSENIPVAGVWIGGILFGFAIPLLFFAFVLSLGLVIGWPMIVAVIACENSDSFDAFSRTFDYLRSRLPGILIAFSLTMAAGIVLLCCAEEIFRNVVHWLDLLRTHFVTETIQPKTGEASWQGSNSFHVLWLTLWRYVLSGYLLAYYWCTISGIYVLARHSVDRMPVDEFQQ